MTPRWKMVTYRGREIETEEDIIWMAKEVQKAYESGTQDMGDMMGLSHLEEIIYCSPEEVEKRRKLAEKEKIKNRFEILDL